MLRDYSVLSDEELALDARCPDAFAELASRYLGLVGNLARKFRSDSSPEDEDLVQEGLLGLYGAALTYDSDGGASFRTYASVCITNRLKNEVRNHSSKKNSLLNNSLSLDDVSLVDMDADVSPELVLESQEVFSAVLNQIHVSLSDFERKVLALYLTGYKRSEISEKLGISVKAFDNALQRARQKLKAPTN